MAPSKARTRIAFLALYLFICLQSAFSQEIQSKNEKKLGDKFKLIIGLNSFNFYTDLEHGWGYFEPELASTFQFAPQLGLDFQLNRSLSFRYIRTQSIKFIPQKALGLASIAEIRKLDRLSIKYHFKNDIFIYAGFTNLIGSSQVGIDSLSPFKTDHFGMQGLHLGFGKRFKYGTIEFSNLFALDFEEMTPASLFGYWVLDFNYVLPLKAQKADPEFKNRKNDIFGFGVVGSLNPFLNRNDYPAHAILTQSLGVELFFNIKMINSSIFFRRLSSIHIIPMFTKESTFSTQWNLLGWRQNLKYKSLSFYASLSYLNGYDNFQTHPILLGGKQSTIHGFNLGIGYPVNRWAFELSTDCYLKTPLPSISKGFGWDRIRLSAMYYLPIATKK